MKRWNVRFLFAAVALATFVAAVGAVVRPTGAPPKQQPVVTAAVATAPLEITSVDDLTGLSDDDLRRLADSPDGVELERLAADAKNRLGELSRKVRSLDQGYAVPAVRSRSGTSSSGSSGRRRAG